MEQFFWEAFNIRGMRLSSRTRGFYPNNHMCHMGFNENAVISMWCTWRAPFCKSIKSEQFGIATQKEIECEIWPIFWGQITSKSSLYKAKKHRKNGENAMVFGHQRVPSALQLTLWPALGALRLRRLRRLRLRLATGSGSGWSWGSLKRIRRVGRGEKLGKSDQSPVITWNQSSVKF